MNSKTGISVIIFCFNSERFIERNLKCIAAQDLPVEVPCEVIVMDNNSTDRTCEIAETVFKSLNTNFFFRIEKEQRQGLSFAREKAIAVAQHEIMVFVDDDNFLENHYLKNAFVFMNEHPEAGVCGSQSIPEYEQQPGKWFEKYKSVIAIGTQGSGIQDITSERKFAWGAGMIIRRSIAQKAFLHGFNFVNTGRKGNQLASSEDIELCYAFIALGFRIYYNDKLRLIHYIPAGRVQWSYIKKIIAGYGASTIWLDVFEWFQKEKYLDFSQKKIYFIHHLVLLKMILMNAWNFVFAKITPENAGTVNKILVKKARAKQFYKIKFSDYSAKVSAIRNFYINSKKNYELS